MNEYEKSIHISDEAFSEMLADADRTMQKLIKNMIEKDSLEGKVTITINVGLLKEYIPNHDPRIAGETRLTHRPVFAHTVGSVMQIKDETKGKKSYEHMELVFDDEKGEYVLRPVANTDQMTIFDAEYRCVNDDAEVVEGEIVDDEPPALEGKLVAALPGPSNDTDGEEPTEEVETEAEGFEEVAEDELEDLSEDFGEPLPFEATEEDYEYEEPEEYEEE